MQKEKEEKLNEDLQGIETDSDDGEAAGEQELNTHITHEDDILKIISLKFNSKSSKHQEDGKPKP